jgi:hypothetical protein
VIRPTEGVAENSDDDCAKAALGAVNDNKAALGAASDKTSTTAWIFFGTAIMARRFSAQIAAISSR